MYKLTYDTDDNDEINAPKDAENGRKSSTDSATKMDVTDSKDVPNGGVSSPKERKRSVGIYEGNGRYYSLFANEDFLTEDKKEEKKKCCNFGAKSIFLFIIIALLLVGVFGLTWTVREMQIKQESFEKRIAALEDLAATSFSASINQHPVIRQASSIETGEHNALQCCKNNQEQITYLNEVMMAQDRRFDDIQDKIQSYRSAGDVTDAQISRNVAENSVEARSALELAASVDKSLEEVKKILEGSNGTDFSSFKATSVTDDKSNEFMNTFSGPRKDTTFGVVHAMGYFGMSDATEDSSEPPTVFYDISSKYTPIVTFTNEIMDDGDNIQPQTGTYIVPQTGNYFLSVGFCVHPHTDAVIQILQNDHVLREYVITDYTRPNADSTLEALSLNSPPGFYSMINKDKEISKPPPAPPQSDSGKAVLRPYQFTEIAALTAEDELSLKIVEGQIAEYTHAAGVDAARSCTRFTGFKI